MLPKQHQLITLLPDLLSSLIASGERAPKIARNRNEPERAPAASAGLPAATEHPRLVQTVLGQRWGPQSDRAQRHSHARCWRNPAETELGRGPVDRPQLENHLAQFAGIAPVRPESRNA